MITNTLLQSLDRDNVLSPRAETIAMTLELLTSAIVGRLIAEQLLDYSGQPGQTIEFACATIADTLVNTLDKVDTVELKRFFEASRSEGTTR